MASNMVVGKIKIENRSGFPLEIIGEMALASDKSIGGMSLVIRRTDDMEVMPPQPVSHKVVVGKLTGVQMRGIAALDQLEALMQDRLAPVIKYLANCSVEELTPYLLNGIGDEDVMSAIKAMALFSYRELVDRGMLPPHEPNQEPNDGDDWLPSTDPDLNP